MAHCERSQYHHYIPRFLLYGFVDDTAAASHPVGGLTKTRQQMKRWEKQNAEINIINLHDGSLVRRRVAKQYGLTDMYRDTRATNQHVLEAKLAVLETQVGTILNNARKAFCHDEGTLMLRRSEKHVPRKFLFLMKYRSSHMYSRFNVTSLEAYSAGDRAKLGRYMATRGFNTPRDVWLANLHTFLDLDMGLGNWIENIQRDAYPDDATMFYLHMQQSYLAFVKPKSPSDEFLLTENAFGIFEGPSSCKVDVLTGETHLGHWTEWHNFAPVSASLLIVLRSKFLPGGVVKPLQEKRSQMYERMLSLHNDEVQAQSILQDLPIEQCKVRYSNGDHLSGFGVATSTDEYTFRCFTLESRYVDVINGLFLEEAHKTAAVTYRSGHAAAKAIRAYLETERPGFKFTLNAESSMPVYLQSLKTALQHLGGEADVVHTTVTWLFPQALLLDYINHLACAVGEAVAEHILYADSPTLGSYSSLVGGRDFNRSQYAYDTEQACRLAYLTIKSDSAMSRVPMDDFKKQRFKLWRLGFYGTLPPQRIWLYVKIMRNLRNVDLQDFRRQLKRLECAGPEDLVAQGSSTIDPGVSSTLRVSLTLSEESQDPTRESLSDRILYAVVSREGVLARLFEQA